MMHRQLRSVATTLHDDHDPVPSATPIWYSVVIHCQSAWSKSYKDVQELSTRHRRAGIRTWCIYWCPANTAHPVQAFQSQKRVLIKKPHTTQKMYANIQLWKMYTKNVQTPYTMKLVMSSVQCKHSMQCHRAHCTLTFSNRNHYATPHINKHSNRYTAELHPISTNITWSLTTSH